MEDPKLQSAFRAVPAFPGTEADADGCGAAGFDGIALSTEATTFPCADVSGAAGGVSHLAAHIVTANVGGLQELVGGRKRKGEGKGGERASEQASEQDGSVRASEPDNSVRASERATRCERASPTIASERANVATTTKRAGLTTAHV